MLLNGLYYRTALAVLRWKKGRTEARLNKRYALARKEGKTPQDIDHMRFMDFEESIGPRDAIHQLQHDSLAREAESYLITLPFSDRPDDERWEQSSLTGKWRLSFDELVKLRSAIRAERRERWESATRWISVISATTGLLGGLIGVLAFWAKSPPAH